ncbi:hypothetical protein D3C84_688960 [compost metagenome]
MQLLDRHRQHQRTGAPEDLQAVGFLGRHDADPGIGPDHELTVDQQAIHPTRYRSVGQPGANTRGNLMHGQRLIVFTH